MGAFSPFVEDDILEHFSGSDSIDPNIYILHGKYDHIDAIHESVHSFLSILKNKSAKYVYKEYPDSHSYGFWKAHIDDLLIAFFKDEN